ncbi:MAG: DUF2283 domain-containing protein [Candidatus Paceibacterota bacterium]
MKITYDKKADAIYITLKKGVVSHSSKMKNHIMIDTDKEGALLGIEILRASSQIANKKPIDIKLTIPALL